MSTRLLIGDCRGILPTLPAQSVHCVVTSPPYWGLRDYGTATWEGGDPGCDHVVGELRLGLGMAALGECYRGGGHKIGAVEPIKARDECPKCGAIRIDAQLGLEPDFNAYVASMVAVFREVRRVLRDDGTLWLNLGDSYNAHPGQRKTTDKMGPKQETNGGSNTTGSRFDDALKPKDLCGIPWRIAFALQADGWYLRQDIIWSKPNPMPESVTDRCTKAHEYMFLLSKRERYYYDAEAIREDEISPGRSAIEIARQQRLRVGNEGRKGPLVNDSVGAWRGDLGDGQYTAGRNKRSVWEVTTQPFSEAHFATFPPALIEPCIKAGCPRDGTVLDPFAGAGTTGLVADRLQRNAILIELNPAYADMSERRIVDDAPLFTEVSASAPAGAR